jgi:hypothetical protein
MVMYGVPKRTPRCGPNGTVPCMDLVDSVGAQLFFDLQNRGPENGPRPLMLAVQKRGIVVIFGL